ncbi:MAG: NADH-quinone oxidoreductase subunit H [Acidobacteria bacterium]|nr:NADH-quinone oxidoreductase subunit H [Acidobacteriota bacterium]
MSEWVRAHPDLLLVLVKVLALVFLLLTGVAYLVWFERKVLAHIQSRWGPYRVGPHGLLQPLADGLKFLFKEEVRQTNVTSPFVYTLAPFLAMTLAMLSIAVIPFGPASLEVFGRTTGLYIADVNIGLLFILAVTSLGVYGIALGGWSSNSKYSMLGGLRSSAQMVSYELALTFSVIGVLLHAGSLSLRRIVEAQGGSWSLPHWYVFPQIVGFVCFFISAVAENNRLPFDLPEAETELVAGFHTEYSSFKFAMFFLAEYAHMITAACLATILYFGGWHSPFPTAGAFAFTAYLPVAVLAAFAALCLWDAVRRRRRLHRVVMLVLGFGLGGLAAVMAEPLVLAAVQGVFWFLAKVVFFLFVYVWIRGTLPRFRYDQLMAFSWKFLVPVAVANVILTSLVVALRAG